MPPAITVGQSSTAEYIAEQIKAGQDRLHDSVSFSLRDVHEELATVAEECRRPGWDGYEAHPVEQDTLRNAYCVIESLPLGSHRPSIGAEPDGHLTLEWHRAPRWTLSVSVSPEGDLHYAALLGSRKASGTEPFLGDIPKAILDLIRQVSAG